MSNNIIDSIQLSGVTYTIQGTGGGGKAIEAGRGISITTGETADTVSFNLPISAGTNSTNIKGGSTSCVSSGNQSFAFGHNAAATSSNSIALGFNLTSSGEASFACGGGNKAIGWYSFAGGSDCNASGTSSLAFGTKILANNNLEASFGRFNASSKASNTFGDSGNTLFSVGNGTAKNARHNAFEIRQNGDIYLTKDGQDVKLQDQLGGGGSITIDPTLDSGSTNAVANSAITTAIDAKVETSAITTSVTSASTDSEIPSAKAVNDKLGGLSIVKLTQSAYDALSPNYDSNTLYVIVN